MNEVTFAARYRISACAVGFFASTTHPGTRARGASLIKRGLQLRSDTEMRLGEAVAEYRAE